MSERDGSRNGELVTVGLLNAIDRVADATGIPLEAEKLEASPDFRAALGVDCFDVGVRI